MEKVFDEMHGNFISKEKNIFDTLAAKTYEKLTHKFPHEVIHCLARTRTYIRLRQVNKKLSWNNCKRKLDRKMNKFRRANIEKITILSSSSQS